MALKNLGDGTLTKLAADANPTASLYPAGMYLQNTDDRKVWINSGTDWILQELVRFKQFRVFKDGATTYVTDRMGRVQQSNTDTQTAVQAQINSMGTDVYEFIWDASPFTMTNPLLHPSIAGGTVQKVIHKGTGFVGQRLTSGGNTCLLPDATFPTNRYFFEANNPGSGSTTTAQVEINGFQAANNTLFTTKNVGFVKFEAGGALNGNENWIVSNCFTNYLWRGIHLIGCIWHGRFENLIFTAGNASFVADADIILEDGGHISSINPAPKENVFRNIRCLHSDGYHTNIMRILSGGYNRIEGLYIGGNKVTHSIISLNNTDALTIHNNTFDNVTCIDLVTPTPDVREASLYMDGTMTFDNVFNNLRISPWTETVKLVGTGVIHNDIEIDAYWGAVSRVTDTGTDGTNTIRVHAGSRTTGADEPIVHTGGVSKVIDSRKGATNAGSATITGDNSTTTFTFVHGLFSTPAFAIVVAGSINIRGIAFYVSWTTTHIQVVFATPPPVGSHTLRFMTGLYK